MKVRIPRILEAKDITKLSNAQINKLRCADFVVKLTGNLQHSYRVSYKEDKVGICLSYSAAGYLETVSYDYVDGNWVYNSTDVTRITDNAQ